MILRGAWNDVVPSAIGTKTPKIVLSDCRHSAASESVYVILECDVSTSTVHNRYCASTWT